MVLVHGVTDTWRSWDLVLPTLERSHDVLAPTLAGHAGGPELPAEITPETLAEGVERQMDEAGFETAHIAGNSLGGFVALQLAARGRAKSVVALAPAGGWKEGIDATQEVNEHFVNMRAALEQAVPNADAIVASANGRRAASMFTAEHWEHIPGELLAHQMRGLWRHPGSQR